MVKVAGFQMPTAATIALTALAVVLQVLNQAVFSLAPQWHAAILVGLVFLAGLGISPASGTKVRAFLHLPAWASSLIAAALAAGTLALTFLPVANVWHVVLAGLLTAAAGMGFAPSVEAVA